MTSLEKTIEQIDNNDLIQKSNSFEIVDNDTLNFANDLLQKAKDTKKELEKQRKSFTDPLNKVKTNIIAVFKPKEKEIDEVIRILSYEKIVPYQQKLNEQIEIMKREERARIANEHAAKIKENKLGEAMALEIEAQEVDSMTEEKGVKSETSSASISMKWVAEVIDNSLVPREFCEPCQKKLAQAIKNGARTIEGVKIFQKRTLTSRRN